MPTPKHAGSFQSYRPSNGTEGDIFMAEWCANCVHNDADDHCSIQLAALVHKISDPEYPPEWSFTNGGVPQCTAFSADLIDTPRCDKTPDLFEADK